MEEILILLYFISPLAFGAVARDYQHNIKNNYDMPLFYTETIFKLSMLSGGSYLSIIYEQGILIMLLTAGVFLSEKVLKYYLATMLFFILLYLIIYGSSLDEHVLRKFILGLVYFPIYLIFTYIKSQFDHGSKKHYMIQSIGWLSWSTQGWFVIIILLNSNPFSGITFPDNFILLCIFTGAISASLSFIKCLTKSLSLTKNP